jgi:hypothetical protein
MKSLIKKLLRENLLSEKLTEVDSDVDLLYDKYFKSDIETIERTGVVTKSMFEQFETDTSILTSPDSIKCHELNPCVIHINPGHNYYSPNKAIIGIGYFKGAYDFIMGYGGGNIKSALDYLSNEKQVKTLIKEFTEIRLKGSIHHELAHWIDDTLNNRHLKARVNKAMERNTRDFGGIPVDATRMEIQAQIHNIKQAYNKNKDVWDELSFQDVLDLLPSLSSVNNKFTGETKAKWRKELKLRMNREGLLGKNMKN